MSGVESVTGSMSPTIVANIVIASIIVTSETRAIETVKNYTVCASPLDSKNYFTAEEEREDKEEEEKHFHQ